MLDGVIALGCPTKVDGSPTGCLLGRALWAALVWERGLTANFIVSGNSVRTPYVEAEALAQLMIVAGVPAERIYLEPNALHTDENIAYSLPIAAALGWQRIAILSDAGHAALGCALARAFGRDTVELGVDREAVAQNAPRQRLLAAVRAPRDPRFIPLADRERLRFEKSGHRRPASGALYAALLAGAAPLSPSVPVLLQRANAIVSSTAKTIDTR